MSLPKNKNKNFKILKTRFKNQKSKLNLKIKFKVQKSISKVNSKLN